MIRNGTGLPTHNAALTGIRGVAAFWVYWHHLVPAAEYLGLPLGGKLLLPAIDQGFHGVDLFFVLSGFILMHVHAGDFRTLAREPLKRFFTLRLFRIYPLHIVVMLLILGSVALFPGFVDNEELYFPKAFSDGGFWNTLLLVQNWGGFNDEIWNPPAWTLSAEVLGYIFFPMLTFAAVRIKRTELAFAAGMGAVALMCLFLLMTDRAFENQWGGYGLIRMALQFSAGICLCQYFHLRGEQSPHAAKLADCSVVAIVLISLFVPGLGAVMPMLFACLVLGLAYQRGFAFKALSSRPVVFMGEISYSFYLVHWLMMHLYFWVMKSHMISRGASEAMLWVGWLAVGIVAYALYRLVELPGRRLGRSVAGRLQGQPRVVTASRPAN
ncbi:MAG: acyltransferase family protein [Povalibacter sp.]